MGEEGVSLARGLISPGTDYETTRTGVVGALPRGRGSGVRHDIDAVLQKIDGQDANPEKRYSPAVCLGCDVKEITGSPDPKHISTSYVERQNLTMPTSMRRFTRLTNAFSKKVENHAAAIALYFMGYNFGRVHQTLRVTPAMEAGVTDHVWSVDEIVGLLEGR